MAHSYNVGSDNPRAKLSDKMIQEIRFMYADGYKMKEIAKQYGVTSSNIWYIVRIRTWKHIKP